MDILLYMGLGLIAFTFLILALFSFADPKKYTRTLLLLVFAMGFFLVLSLQSVDVTRNYCEYSVTWQCHDELVGQSTLGYLFWGFSGIIFLLIIYAMFQYYAYVFEGKEKWI